MNDTAWHKLGLQGVLSHLSGRLSARKARLIACGCARETLRKHAGGSHDAIQLAERFADGQATAHQLAAARYGGRFQPGHAAWPVCWSPDVDQEHFLLLQRTVAWVVGIVGDVSPTNHALRTEARLAEIVRDVAGNPFQPRPIEPAWLAWNDGTAAKMARAIYDERAYDQLPILGDALEEAGCADQAILDHCRAERGHVRGCWLLDAILGL